MKKIKIFVCVRCGKNEVLSKNKLSSEEMIILRKIVNHGHEALQEFLDIDLELVYNGCKECQKLGTRLILSLIKKRIRENFKKKPP